MFIYDIHCLCSSHATVVKVQYSKEFLQKPTFVVGPRSEKEVCDIDLESANLKHTGDMDKRKHHLSSTNTEYAHLGVSQKAKLEGLVMSQVISRRPDSGDDYNSSLISLELLR